MIINITMTAIRRPELHERVLKSFCEKMFYPAMEKDKKLSLHLFVNIDPVGTNRSEKELEAPFDTLLLANIIYSITLEITFDGNENSYFPYANSK